MNLLGNIVWLLLGGLAVAVEYFVSGLALCLTIVGHSVRDSGAQVRIAGPAAVRPNLGTDSQGTGCLYTLMNVIWFFLGGIWIVLTHLLFGALLFITIVGIPFGRQHFKLMSMALTPFGRNIVPTAAL